MREADARTRTGDPLLTRALIEASPQVAGRTVGWTRTEHYGNISAGCSWRRGWRSRAAAEPASAPSSAHSRRLKLDLVGCNELGFVDAVVRKPGTLLRQLDGTL